MRNLFSISVAQVLDLLDTNSDCQEFIFIADDETLSICPVEAKGAIDLGRCTQLSKLKKDKGASGN